jgi:hypothetical protein
MAIPSEEAEKIKWWQLLHGFCPGESLNTFLAMVSCAIKLVRVE